MFGITFKLTVVFLIVSPSFSAQNVRKYNVEEESFKLYKQDFKSVLKRFRRTTDYLKILQDRLMDLKLSMREMCLQVLHYFHNKMEKKVTETLGGSGANKVEEKKTFLRSNPSRETPPPQISEDDWKKISELDNYNMFYSHLTVPERNTLKEMGFSFAGQVIHTIIINSRAKSDEDKFTKLPFGSDIINKFTTIHPEDHEVTYWQYIVGDSAKQNKEPQPLDENEKEAVTQAGNDNAKFRVSDVQMNVNQTMVKKQAIPIITTKGTTKLRVSNNWNRPTYSGFSEATRSTPKVVTSIVTFSVK